MYRHILVSVLQAALVVRNEMQGHEVESASRTRVRPVVPQLIIVAITALHSRPD